MVQEVLKTSIYEVKCFCEKENGIEAGGWARQGCNALFLVVCFGLNCSDPFQLAVAILGTCIREAKQETERSATFHLITQKTEEGTALFCHSPLQ